MKVVINLDVISKENVEEIYQSLSKSIDYSIESEEMNENYEAVQEIQYYLNEVEQ